MDVGLCDTVGPRWSPAAGFTEVSLSPGVFLSLTGWKNERRSCFVLQPRNGDSVLSRLLAFFSGLLMSSLSIFGLQPCANQPQELHAVHDSSCVGVIQLCAALRL